VTPDRQMGCWSRRRALVALTMAAWSAIRSSWRRSIYGHGKWGHVGDNLGQRSHALYGSEVGRGQLDDPELASLIAAECDIITSEGPFVWRYLEPTRYHYSYDEAERVLAFCKPRGILVRGGPLVWHDLLPAWVPHALLEGAQITFLTDFISTVVHRFAGRIHSWDVLNEVVEPASGRSDGLRVTPWLDVLGPDYMAAAFTAARQADPRTLLGYNEFGLEPDTPFADRKRAAALALIHRFVSSGVPIDYLGVQAHLTAGETYSDRGLGTLLKEIADLGILAFVTELDVNDQSLPSDPKVRDVGVASQVDRFLDVALRNVKLPLVITWGVTDRTTWQQQVHPRADSLPQRALPFDADLKPKETWDVLVRRLGLVRPRQ